MSFRGLKGEKPNKINDFRAARLLLYSLPSNGAQLKPP
jgi:hypothetical protein